MTTPNSRSAAAQSVQDAAFAQLSSLIASPNQLRRGLAATIRAAADQVTPANGSRCNNQIRAELLSIAVELSKPYG